MNSIQGNGGSGKPELYSNNIKNETPQNEMVKIRSQ